MNWEYYMINRIHIPPQPNGTSLGMEWLLYAIMARLFDLLNDDCIKIYISCITYLTKIQYW